MTRVRVLAYGRGVEDTAHAAHWLRTGPPRPAYVLSLVLAVTQVFGTFGSQHNQPEHRQLDALGIILLVAAPAALAARRRYPVATLVAVSAIVGVYLQLGYAWGPFILSLFVAMVNAVVRGHRLVAWVVVCVLYANDLSLSLARNLNRDTWQSWLAVAAILGLVLVAGDIARTTTEAGLSARRAVAEERRRQASDERLRMARELHDVLAHNISLINVQAGVALHLMDGDPEQARTALTAIKQASKDTLGELRAALGVLRGDGDDAAPRSPTPGLAQLPELIEQVRAAGHPVLTDLGELPELPAPVQLAAFRIVQEALTNVRRHAGTATATVTMRYRDGELTVRVDDDGTTAAATGPHGQGTTAYGIEQGAGSGIAGMRERATALGGTLRAGPRQDGGFRVEAVLPAPAARMVP